MKKQIKRITVIAFILLSFVYLITSFITWEINPANWGEVSRFIVGGIFTPLCVAASIYIESLIERNE